MAHRGPARRPGTRPGRGTRGRRSWPPPAGPGSRRTTARGPGPGTAAPGARVRAGAPGWTRACGRGLAGGGTPLGPSWSARPLLLFLRLRPVGGARRPVGRGGSAGRQEDEGRGSRCPGSAASRRTSRALAQWVIRGQVTRGGALRGDAGDGEARAGNVLDAGDGGAGGQT